MPSGQNGSQRSPLLHLLERQELAAHDLLGLEAERPLVTGAVHHAVHERCAASSQRNGNSSSSGAVTPSSSRSSRARTVAEVLARRQHAADAGSQCDG